MLSCNAYTQSVGLSWLNALLYKLTFRYMLLPRAYSRQQFEEMAAKSRLRSAEIGESGIGFEVVLKK